MGEQRYTLDDHERYVAEREAERRKAEADRSEMRAKEAARRAWLQDGGRERDFEKMWPTLRDEMRSRRVSDADQQAREAQRRAGVSSI